MTRTTIPQRQWYELAAVDVPSDLSRLRIRAVPYGVWTNRGWGSFLRISAGAPDKSIREAAKGLPLLLFHDHDSLPIGKSVAWTLDDPTALIGEWQIDLDDPVAVEAARKARDGYLTGASIGFQPIRSTRVFNDSDDWDDAVSRAEGLEQVTHHELRLMEVSLTPTPQYADAGVLSLSAAPVDIPDRDTIRRPVMDPATRLAIDAFRRTVTR
jgi:HK97 family phage prohead protease